jgi:hypothetical protein
MGFKINVNTRTDTAEGLEEKRYLLKVSKVEPWLNDIEEQVGIIIRFTCHDTANPEVVEGQSYDRFPNSAKMIWKLRGFLYAAGVRKKSAFEIDSDELLNKECLGDLTWYKGNKGNLPNWKFYALDEAPEEAPAVSSDAKSEEEAPAPDDDDTPF